MTSGVICRQLPIPTREVDTPRRGALREAGDLRMIPAAPPTRYGAIGKARVMGGSATALLLFARWGSLALTG